MSFDALHPDINFKIIAKLTNRFCADIVVVNAISDIQRSEIEYYVK